jgi:hypothetical protein
MNPTYFKLLLALLWLVPGLGFLALDAVSGQAHTLSLGTLRVPFAWVFLIFAAFNFVRWWATRSVSTERSPLLERRHRPRPQGVEPDSAFRFDDPPAPEAPPRER